MQSKSTFLGEKKKNTSTGFFKIFKRAKPKAAPTL